MHYHRTTLVRHAEVIIKYSQGVHHCDMPYYSPAGALGIIYKYKHNDEYRMLIDEIIKKKNQKQEKCADISMCKLSVNRHARVYYEYLKEIKKTGVIHTSLNSLYTAVAGEQFSIKTVRRVIISAQKNKSYREKLLKYIDECIENK